MVNAGYVGLIMLAECVYRYLVQVSLLLIGQQVGTFLQVCALASHWLEDCANCTAGYANTGGK